MNKTIKIYIFLFVAILIVMIANDSQKPKKVDWASSFLSKHKKPYGTYVLYKELNTFFPSSSIKKVTTTPFEFLSEDFHKTSNGSYSEKMNYLFVNDYVNFGDPSCEELLYFVQEGNTVFMAGHDFPEYLKDSLRIKTAFNYDVKPEVTLTLSNKKLSRTTYNYSKAVDAYYFNKLDKATTTVLGYNELNQKKKINFIKVKYGKGFFYLNTQPFAFTNYHMLTSDHAVYVSNVLSYLPDNKLIWDERIKANTGEVGSPMRYIISQPPLRYAWYLALFSIFLFMLFRAKRRQRIVPIIEKLPNTSIAFAKTIGDLYYQQGEPKDIISKKIKFFLAHIRNTYLLDTQNLNKDFKKRLHLKSGVPFDEVNRLIDYIVDLNKKAEPKENSLVTLTKIIDKFYTKTNL